MANPKWKYYEWLVAKFIHDKDTCAFSRTVTYDIKIPGKISGENRQIDILIEEIIDGKPILTIIDCKDKSRACDIKAIEEFIGMVDDVQADRGMIYSANGFTSGACNRVSRRTDITLKQFDWESANDIQEEALIPNRLQDSCIVCRDEDTNTPGMIIWEHGKAIFFDGSFSQYSTGSCLRCKQNYIWCDPCGAINPVTNEDFTCPECEVSYP